MTTTFTDWLAEPFLPRQLNPNVVDARRPATVSLPEVARAPDQPSDAVQDVAFVELQLSVTLSPSITVAGDTESDTVGVFERLVFANGAETVSGFS